MRTRSLGWSLTYHGSWMVALALPGAVVVPLAADKMGAIADDAWLGIGAIAGAMLGVALARVTRGSPAMHRLLRYGGPLLAVVALVGAVYLFRLAYERRNDGQMFSGVGEFLMAMASLLVAGSGAALWLAGFSGPRAAAVPPG